jgi:hypothetical protein
MAHRTPLSPGLEIEPADGLPRLGLAQLPEHKQEKAPFSGCSRPLNYLSVRQKQNFNIFF